MSPPGRWWPEVRQRRQPPAFRIPPVAEDAWAADLARILAAVPEPAVAVKPAVAPEPEPVEEAGGAGAGLDDRGLAEAATSLWRAQRRLERDDTPATSRDRQTRRYLLACRDALTDAGLVIQDHEGDPFHAGRSIEVLVFQEDPALHREVVLETVRPTVYLHERRIQTGQVIVGGPPATGSVPQPDDEVGNHAGQ